MRKDYGIRMTGAMKNAYSGLKPRQRRAACDRAVTRILEEGPDLFREKDNLSKGYAMLPLEIEGLLELRARCKEEGVHVAECLRSALEATLEEDYGIYLR